MIKRLVFIVIVLCIGLGIWSSNNLTYNFNTDPLTFSTNAEKQQYLEEGIETDPPLIKVTKTYDGWKLTQKNDYINLTPATYPSMLLMELFPELIDQSDIQCATSARIILCHVKPFSVIGSHEDKFVSTTGYFIIKLHYGLVELNKVSL